MFRPDGSGLENQRDQLEVAGATCSGGIQDIEASVWMQPIVPAFRRSAHAWSSRCRFPLILLAAALADFGLSPAS